MQRTSLTGGCNLRRLPSRVIHRNPVVLRDIVWCTGTTSGLCDGFINPGAAVDGNGVAVCGAGINKSFTILAGRSSSISMPDRGIQLDIFGSATLICP